MGVAGQGGGDRCVLWERRGSRAGDKGGAARPAAQSAAAGCGHARRGAALDPRGGGLGQDAGAHPPHRLAGARGAGAARRDHGRHLHQQGGGRAEGARREAGRARGAAALGRDLSRGGRADPAPRVRGAEPRPRLRHLRRAGHARRVQTRLPGPGARRQQREGVPRAHRRLEERGAAAGRGATCSVRRARPDGEARLRALPARAAAGLGGGLRRPDRAGDRAVPRAAGDPRALCGALPLSIGRRVSGHEPGPVHALAAARLRARKPVRGGRRRPVDLPLARRDGRQHPRLPPPLSRHQRRQAGAELPLEREHPRRRARGHRAQRAARRQEALDRCWRGREAAGDSGGGRARRGATHRRRARGRECSRHRVRGDGRLLSRQRAVAGARGRAAGAAHSLPGGARAFVLRPGRGEGCRGLSAPLREPPLGQRSAAHHQHAFARNRRHHRRAPARLRLPRRFLALGSAAGHGAGPGAAGQCAGKAGPVSRADCEAHRRGAGRGRSRTRERGRIDRAGARVDRLRGPSAPRGRGGR